MATDPWPGGNPIVTFQIGEFTFDSTSRLLLHKGVERHLSPKAQQLLLLLLEARPRALSRDALYDALWPSTFVCETNLATIVNELRRALGDDAHASQFIRTVHGFGYAFCGEVASQVEIPFLDAMLLCDERSYQLFEGDNAVGRTPDCRIVINDPTVSRRHALILIGGRGDLSIKDLDSKNGTRVDGQRIGRSPVMVTQGVELVFGAVVASIISRKISSTATLRLNTAALKRLVAERPASA